jgi:hypothetical protein
VSAFGEWWEKPLHTCTHGFSFIPNHERNPVGAPRRAGSRRTRRRSRSRLP